MKSKGTDYMLNPVGDIERFFCCALSDDRLRHRDELPALWKQMDVDAAWCFAVENRAESVVALALRDGHCGALPDTRWEKALKTVENRTGAYMAQLDRVAKVFEDESIALVGLKNSGIARGIYPHLAGCPMGDVDVLVDPTQFYRAHAILTRLGYTLDSRSPFQGENLEEAERHGGAEYTLPLQDGEVFWLELQWRPVAGRWIRPDQEPKAADLISRSVPIPGTSVRLLSPEDNLLQVCLHTAKHSFVRAPGFRLHTDVDRIVRRCAINWESFVVQAKSLKVCTAVYLSLAIPRDLLWTPVPQWVLDSLFPGTVKSRLMLGWLRRVGMFNPGKRKWTKVGYILFTALLYDDISGLIRGIFPSRDWMRKRYSLDGNVMLPVYYARHVANLLLKRART